MSLVFICRFALIPRGPQRGCNQIVAAHDHNMSLKRIPISTLHSLINFVWTQFHIIKLSWESWRMWMQHWGLFSVVLFIDCSSWVKFTTADWPESGHASQCIVIIHVLGYVTSSDTPPLAIIGYVYFGKQLRFVWFDTDCSAAQLSRRQAGDFPQDRAKVSIVCCHYIAPYVHDYVVTNYIITYIIDWITAL